MYDLGIDRHCSDEVKKNYTGRSSEHERVKSIYVRETCHATEKQLNGYILRGVIGSDVYAGADAM